MASPSNEIELSSPDPERQLARPSTSFSERISSIVPIQHLAQYFNGFWQALKQCERMIHQPIHQKRDANKDVHAPFSIDLRRPARMDAPIHERAGQRCFLCLEKGQNQLAIAVPCFRPTKPRQVKFSVNKPVHVKIGRKEKIVECDAAIFEKLNSACFEYHGAWKTWLPFYGITNVEEVHFQFLGVVEKDGTYPIHMTTLDITKIQDELDEIIEMDLNRYERDFGDACTDDKCHSTRCGFNMKLLSQPCVWHRVLKARQRKQRLSRLEDLSKCAKRPSEANGLRTLGGMATDSCIYDIEALERGILPIRHRPYERVDKLRGLRYTVGWQKDRLRFVLPRNIAWAFVGIAIAGLCVGLWDRSKGGWGTAFGLGQLILAGVMLLLMYT